ncbi:hypothetical protein K431DRAFT_328605 [Polychaeton citri CBS 116435]|uniref:Uncharacterized protein n=1 Tax=Polychaeton citri CBS 116435 TaxID=1314669 RepID=A0A9P4Q8U3_9PEZI|nr:hypothetical protein K431DRAFT_328605 [Polychaeton citri CBS 116435]
MPDPLATIFVNFDEETGGVHNVYLATDNTLPFLGRTRRQVRSEAARRSHRSAARKPKTSKKLRVQIQVKASASSETSGSTTGFRNTTSGGIKSRTPISEDVAVAAEAIAKPSLIDEPSSLHATGETSVGPTKGTAPSSQLQNGNFQSAEVCTSVLSDSAKNERSSADTATSTLNLDAPSTRSPSPPRSPPKAVEVEHCWPVPFQPFFPQLIDYMWPFMMRGWTRMPTEAEERDAALVWVQRLTVSDPCYFYMNMLSVAFDLSSRNMLDRRIAEWLLAETVSSINRALCDAQQRLAVGTILTVGRIALHEITLGDREAGRCMHRPAQVRMLNMAGGLDALGLPPLVKKHVLWADRLMAMQTGIAMIPVDYSRAPAAERGTGQDADLRVLDAYMPVRSRDNGRI